MPADLRAPCIVEQQEVRGARSVLELGEERPKRVVRYPNVNNIGDILLDESQRRGSACREVARPEHPVGRVATVVGRDRGLREEDLARGKGPVGEEKSGVHKWFHVSTRRET